MVYFEDIIEEIENNITDDIQVDALAKKLNMSVYEFRRIFAFITKIPFSDYIRKRRLSLAALELYESKKSVTEIAQKYGYDSPSSFSRAFREFHKLSPSDVLSGKGSFNLLTRISTEITTTGGADLPYTVCRKKAFWVNGYFGKSDLTDTECCDDVWNGFFESGAYDGLSEKTDKLYAVYLNDGNSVDCVIGCIEKGEKGIFIPESEWVCFKLKGTQDDYVNKFYKDILNQWFSSVKYLKNNNIPNIEVFPYDMSDENFEWEIWIPFER